MERTTNSDGDRVAPGGPVASTIGRKAGVPSSGGIRVAVVEDDRFLRERLAEDVASEPGFLLVGKFGSAEESVALLPGLLPEVVLMDIGLPGMNGIDGVRQLKRELPGVQFLMLTVYEDGQQIFDALLAGASGYLLKRTSRAELFDAIRQIHLGGSPMSGHIARKVVQYFNRRGEQTQELERLSPREREVLDLLAQGAAYKEIAESLHLSIETIRMNVKGIYTKLHVHSRGEAVAKYLRRCLP
jgi:DNA-binding NarL/FixJ family response regulator